MKKKRTFTFQKIFLSFFFQMAERTAGLLALDTKQELHMIAANVLARDILLKQGDRFRKTQDGKGVKWTSLCGGSFTSLATFATKPQKSRDFLGGILSKSWIGPSELSRPERMTMAKTRAIPLTNVTMACHRYLVLLFPSQWEDCNELKTSFRSLFPSSHNHNL